MVEKEHCTCCPLRYVSELIPPDAQEHLVTAQRELLLAALATLDYHGGHATTTARKKPAPKKRGKSTVQKIDIE